MHKSPALFATLAAIWDKPSDFGVTPQVVRHVVAHNVASCSPLSKNISCNSF